MMHAKGYCRDALHRDSSQRDRFLHLRRWTSPEMRSEAQVDPEVHRYWQMLPNVHHPYCLREPGEGVRELADEVANSTTTQLSKGRSSAGVPSAHRNSQSDTFLQNLHDQLNTNVLGDP